MFLLVIAGGVAVFALVFLFALGMCRSAALGDETVIEYPEPW